MTNQPHIDVQAWASNYKAQHPQATNMELTEAWKLFVSHPQNEPTTDTKEVKPSVIPVDDLSITELVECHYIHECATKGKEVDIATMKQLAKQANDACETRAIRRELQATPMLGFTLLYGLCIDMGWNYKQVNMIVATGKVISPLVLEVPIKGSDRTNSMTLLNKDEVATLKEYIKHSATNL